MAKAQRPRNFPTIVPLVKISDLARGTICGDRCCILGWAGRIFGCGGYSLPFAARKFVSDVIRAAGGPDINPRTRQIEEFNQKVYFWFDQTQGTGQAGITKTPDAWAKTLRDYGLTATVEVPRPATRTSAYGSTIL